MVGVNGYGGSDRRGFERPGARIGDPHAIVRALRRATGPITIIAGEQVARDDARSELEELRALLRAQVACVPDAKDVAGTPGFGSSSALGVTGVMGHPGVADAVAASAVCLVVGTRLSVTARAGLDDALAAVRTVSIGSASPYLPCTHVHTEDLRGSLTMLTRALSGRGRARDCACQISWQTPNSVHRRSPVRVCATAMRWSCSIACCPTEWTSSSTPATPAQPQSITSPFAGTVGSRSHSAWAGMGYSFGAGIGMAFGRATSNGPSRRTVVIAGDGAFFMHGMEVHTAVQYRLPVTFVLFNNNAHAMCVTREQLFYDDLYSYNRFAPSQLGAGLAGMFPGLSSVDVADIDALPAALERAMAVDGPSVVTVECSADEIPPFAAFLNRQPANQVVEQQITTPKENRFHVPSSA